MGSPNPHTAPVSRVVPISRSGGARNRAIAMSSGEYLCIQDSDDIMLPERLRLQLEKNIEVGTNYIIGSQVIRNPRNSTVRYTRWLNTLPQELLTIRLFTSHGPTVCQPTWFFHKSVFERQGNYIGGVGYPEDQEFFLRHVLEFGGDVYRVELPLIIYRFHPDCVTHSIGKDIMWAVRLYYLEKFVLPHWKQFTIWSAGKQGRKLFRSLSKSNQQKVKEFCDVDQRKIGHYYEHQESTESPKPKISIHHFGSVRGPFVVCVKTDLHEGGLEENIRMLNLDETFQNYIHFG